ncbi:hypothetical protein ABDJ41_10285 [Pedobacter sp. ASV1-7]|uniref:hypothetical protein n=1 Tax=Pedobacter sp. ASV1-7 TaxID=3145237 RepID=UPI0032E8654E
MSERYSQYDALLVQLANCIAEYEALYKEVRVNVLGPALRQARKKMDKDGINGIMLKFDMSVI